ncbi:MAG: transposase [Acidobacteria bacterium]|nr:transposase [Acidobacteriota bacterium]
MAIIPQGYLLNWREIDAASDLDRLRLVLGAIPDEPLMRILEQERGNGRDEYPIRSVWNSILAGVVFQHPSVACLRRELRRNAELRQLCGFDPLLGEGAVPTDSAYSNFLECVMRHEEMIRDMFHVLVEKLRADLPDLGKYLAIDGKALPSFGRPQKDKQTDGGDDKNHNGQKEPTEGDKSSQTADSAEEPDRRAEHDADWGVKTYRGKRKDGTAWEKVVRWFGFELHLLVDAAHELPVNYQVTKASAAESPLLLPIVEQTKELHPEVIENCEELSADKGYDSEKNNKDLYDSHRIHPIIDKRSDWKDTTDMTRPLFPDRADTVVYDVKGRICCVCPKTGEMRPMAAWGFEPDRKTLKYRCPAAVFGFECKGRQQCPGAQTDYGKIVRISIDTDRRMFTPIARDTAAWERAYDRRTAVERVNSRIDQVLGFERHTIRGLKKMEARVGIALIVLLSMALGRIQVGQREQMRSLLVPVIRAA